MWTVEVKNNLLNFKDKIIYQNSDWFMFSIDSVLLANFVSLRPKDELIFDLATGNAPIAMLLTYKTKAKINGVELQKEIYDLGVKSVVENNFNNQIELFNIDIGDIKDNFSAEIADVITCNPPFFKTGHEKNMNDVDIKTIARHEVKLDLDTLLKSASYLLKNKGIFAMVHRPDRLTEIILSMKKYKLEPKRIQFVYSNSNKNSNILLIEGVKNGNLGIKVLPPFYVHNNDGTYTKEVKKMFEE